VLNDSTGANVIAGVNNAVVIDDGGFDCDNDGGIDPNIVTGAARGGSVPSDATGDLAPSRTRHVAPL
jgi:hypothetical protein